jgi:hypothetical protein
MADSKRALARKRLKVLAEGVSADGLVLAADRVVLGHAAAEDDFSAAAVLEAGVPRLEVRGASLGFSGSEYPLVVEAELTVPLDAAVPQDGCAVDNLVTALRAAWLNPAAYPAGELAAGQVDVETPRGAVRGDLTVERVLLLAGFPDPGVG